MMDRDHTSTFKDTYRLHTYLMMVNDKLVAEQTEISPQRKLYLFNYLFKKTLKII